MTERFDSHVQIILTWDSPSYKQDTTTYRTETSVCTENRLLEQQKEKNKQLLCIAESNYASKYIKSNVYKLNCRSNVILTIMRTLGHHGDVEKLKADRTTEEGVYALTQTKNKQDLMSANLGLYRFMTVISMALWHMLIAVLKPCNAVHSINIRKAVDIKQEHDGIVNKSICFMWDALEIEVTKLYTFI